MDHREWLQTLRAEYAELTALQPVVGVGYRWQLATSMASGYLFAAARGLDDGRPLEAVTRNLRRAEAALDRMRAMVAQRDLVNLKPLRRSYQDTGAES